MILNYLEMNRSSNVLKNIKNLDSLFRFDSSIQPQSSYVFNVNNKNTIDYFLTL